MSNGPDVDAILRRHDTLVTARSPWESHWSQIARRVLPRADNFTRTYSPGARRTDYIHDSTAQIALGKFAAGMEGLVAPRGQRWHGLTHPDPDLAAKPEIKLYFEAVTNILFQVRYSASAGFATNFHETMVGTGAFGTGPMWVEGLPGRGLIYSARDLSEMYLDQGQDGRIDTVSRKFTFTARQAAQKWDAAMLPGDIRTAAAESPDKTFDFVHFINPRTDFDPARADHKGMAWSSVYIALASRTVVSEGGFHTMPLPTCRYVTAPLEVYGRSPAMDVLADIKMVNEMAKTMMRAGHRAVDPPLLVAEDGVLSRLQTRPGALNYGGIDARGNAMVRPLEGGGSLEFGLKMIEDARATIKEGFLVTLFQMLAEAGSDRMTATEVLERVQEKGVLLAPAAGRIETELLGPLIEREIDILGRAGRLPPMPQILAEQGGDYKVVYDNPMSRAVRAGETAAFGRVIQLLAPVAQTDPTVFDIFDPDAVAHGIADNEGVPQAWRRTPEALAALKAQRTSAQEAQQVATAAPLIAKASLDGAKANQIADPTVANAA